jgi:[2Fe-2S] binding domain
VTLSRRVGDQEEVFTVNSCLRPLASVDGWSVTTTEGLCQANGDLHPVQQRIADFHGSQCGFCTPGMVMTAYAALRKHPEIKKQCMEQQFDGNLCRCTGYRPILDAAKSFAVDVDIEEIAGRPCFPKPGPYDPELDPRVPKFMQSLDTTSELRISANGYDQGELCSPSSFFFFFLLLLLFTLQSLSQLSFPPSVYVCLLLSSRFPVLCVVSGAFVSVCFSSASPLPSSLYPFSLCSSFDVCL